MDMIVIDGTDVEIPYSVMVSSNMNQILGLLKEAREELEEKFGPLEDGDVMEKTMGKLRNATNIAFFSRQNADGITKRNRN